MSKIYYTRDKCIFCKSNNLINLFDNDFKCSVSLSMVENINSKSYFMPYNILVCNNCNTIQNKYLAEINLVYEKNHIDDYGLIKSQKHSKLADFILENKNIDGIIEVGACNLVLASNIINKRELKYSIIEPSITKNSSKFEVIPKYFEEVDLEKLDGNVLVLSDVFEHFYEPLQFLEKVKNSKNIKYIYLNHPDFDSSLKNNFYINLNCEHTFLIEHQFLFKLFENYNFKLKRRFDIKNFSLYLEFERDTSKITNQLENINLLNNSKIYYDSIINKVNEMNRIIKENENKEFYIWPTSMHISPLLTFGLDTKKINGVLDNSPNKINKYLYGYNLKCFSFDKILESNNENICVFVGGAGNYINEIKNKNTKVKIIFLDDI